MSPWFVPSRDKSFCGGIILRRGSRESDPGCGASVAFIQRLGVESQSRHPVSCMHTVLRCWSSPHSLFVDSVASYSLSWPVVVHVDGPLRLRHPAEDRHGAQVPKVQNKQLGDGSLGKGVTSSRWLGRWGGVSSRGKGAQKSMVMAGLGSSP